MTAFNDMLYQYDRAAGKRSSLRRAVAVLGIVYMAGAAMLLGGCAGDRASQKSVDELIDSGLESLRVFNFKEAREPLHAAMDRLEPGEPQWALATYSLALATWHTSPAGPENVKDATVLLEEVVRLAPESPYAPSALLDLGRIAEVSDFLGDPTDVEAAREYYQRVRSDFSNTDMSARATLYYAQSLAQTLDPSDVRAAISALEAEMDAQPDSSWYATMAQYAAQLYAFYLDDPKAALKPYGEAARVGFPRSADADLYLWQYGLLAQEAGEDLVAAEAYSRIVREYPRSVYGSLARERIIAIAHNNPQADIVIPERKDIGMVR